MPPLTPITLISWNVNSLRRRLDQLARLIEAHAPDVISLQETKVSDADFPHEELAALGWAHRAVHGDATGHGGRNGVAILSRWPLAGITAHARRGRRDGRHLSATVLAPGGPVDVHALYVPAGGEAPDPRVNAKFADKLKFIDDCADHFAGSYGFRDAVIVTGDLNIAPLPADVWDHHLMSRRIGHTAYDIAALDRLRRSLNFTDAVREIVPPGDPVFTWWSYRQSEFRVDSKGWRLDHVWVSPGLKDAIAHAEVLVDVRHWTPPSDHAPVLVKLNARRRD